MLGMRMRGGQGGVRAYPGFGSSDTGVSRLMAGAPWVSQSSA